MLKRFSLIFIVIVLFAIPLTAMPVSADGAEQNYVVNLRGNKQDIPMCYSVVKTFSFFNLGTDFLKSPTDIYIDGKDQLYILDAGNGRIIKLSPEGEIIKEYIPEGEAAFNQPKGLYVDEDENIYVADTENKRIIVFDKGGNKIKQYVQPTSKLYDKEFEFKPLKIGIDNLGQLYVINTLDYHGFILLDKDNNFKGNLAATRIITDIYDKLIEKFGSEAQKKALNQKYPASHNNFSITPDGSIFTVTSSIEYAQLKRFSPAGNNFYPKQDKFGDNGKTNFVDVCVDENYIVSILDNISGNIYQYDQDGLMLTVFGGAGNWKGKFQNAVAMDIDSKGQIYVLDMNLGTVQVFQPTYFINTVHTALKYYYNGNYFKAQEYWEEILNLDSAYPVAHIGMGKAELKKHNYESAMVEYKTAGDQYGYSDAFNGYFKGLVQKYFSFIVLGVCAFIALIYIISSKLNKKAKIYSGGRVV